jgi:hypothetical protein
MKWSVLMALLALSVVTATAKEPKTRDLLYAYDVLTEKGDRQGRQWVEAFIGEIVQGMIIANQMLNSRKQPPLFCPPNIKITNSQMIEMMRKTIRENPKWGDFRSAAVVLIVLQDTFLCHE